MSQSPSFPRSKKVPAHICNRVKLCITMTHQNHVLHSSDVLRSNNLANAEQLGESCLPSWLSVPDPKPPTPSKEVKALRVVEYEQMFERIIEGIYRGRSLQSIVQDDARIISYEHFLSWIKRDPQRYERFKEAQEMRTEFMVGEILEIADGVNSIDPTSNDTVNRDRIRIETRKFIMTSHNRKRYGESKQIEVNGQISISEALAAAQNRIIEADILDVTPKLEND